MQLPIPRLPEWSMIQRRSASSRQSSMKWFPPPSVPSWRTQVSSKRFCIFASFGCLSAMRSSARAKGCAASPSASAASCWSKPTGTAASIAPRTRCIGSGSSAAESDKRTADIPQPISTPTAAGMIAPLVGITEPTVAPMPVWTSGIAATCRNTNGRRATLASCFADSPSSSLVHTWTGTRSPAIVLRIGTSEPRPRTQRLGRERAMQHDKLAACFSRHADMFSNEPLAKVDPELWQAVQSEIQRQEDHIELIASENYASPQVLRAQGSVLTNKYAEGYPGKRYYGGCEYIDIAEALAIERAKKLFHCEYANVQPHSGSQANQAVYAAVLKPGDSVLGMSLAHGGHLTHGSTVNFSGRLYQAFHYGLDDREEIDYEQVEHLAKGHKVKLIVAGASAYALTI